MAARPSFRPFHRGDAVATALARAAGPHGVYVHNALGEGSGSGFVFGDGERDVGLCWVGPRGNLVLVGGEALPQAMAVRVVERMYTMRRSFRIAMGPAPLIDALRQRIGSVPLVFRDQVYYCGDAAGAARELVRDDVRAADRADRELLARATLQLNASDLGIAPSRVDRRWLYDTIDERIRDGSSRVIGPAGGIFCKLDVGSRGPGGEVIEGVFTFAEHRGEGLASGLVATCLSAAEGAVCLHVGRDNRPARRAYERAGMREAGQCRLLLVG